MNTGSGRLAGSTRGQQQQLEKLKADARRGGGSANQNARPISSLLAQLKDFTVEMSPERERRFPQDRDERRAMPEYTQNPISEEEEGNDDDESDRIMADLAKLLPGRGKVNMDSTNGGAGGMYNGRFPTNTTNASGRQRSPTRTDTARSTASAVSQARSTTSSTQSYGAGSVASTSASSLKSRSRTPSDLGRSTENMRPRAGSELNNGRPRTPSDAANMTSRARAGSEATANNRPRAPSDNSNRAPIVQGTTRPRLVVPPRRVVTPGGSLSPSLGNAPYPLRTTNTPNSPALLTTNTSTSSSSGAPVSPLSPNPTSQTFDSTISVLMSLQITNPFDTTRPLSPRDAQDATFVMPSGKRLSSYTSVSSSVADVADGMIMQLLVQQSLLDAAGFRILSSEAYEDKKRSLSKMVMQVGELRNRLGLEVRVRDAAMSLTKLGRDRDRGDYATPGSRADGKEKVDNAARKVDNVVKDMVKCLQSMVEMESSVVGHLAGVLRWQVLQYKDTEKQGAEDDNGRWGNGGRQNAGFMKDREREKDSVEKLASAETKIREQSLEISTLKRTITKLQLEQEPLKQLASEAKSMMRRSRDITSELLSNKSNAPPTSTAEVNRLRLDLATCRAELASTKQSLDTSRDRVASLSLQLDDANSLIEEREREIADLRAEVEERENYSEFERAREMSSAKRSLRDRNGDRDAEKEKDRDVRVRELMSEQVKDAVMERERLRVELAAEKEVVRDLQTRLQELTQSQPSSRPTNGRTPLKRRNVIDDDAETESESDESPPLFDAGRKTTDVVDRLRNTDSINSASSLDPRRVPSPLPSPRSPRDKEKDELISSLRQQLASTSSELASLSLVPPPAISSTDIDSLRTLYGEMETGYNRMPFSVAALCSAVRRVMNNNDVNQRNDLEELRSCYMSLGSGYNRAPFTVSALCAAIKKLMDEEVVKRGEEVLELEAREIEYREEIQGLKEEISQLEREKNMMMTSMKEVDGWKGSLERNRQKNGENEMVITLYEDKMKRLEKELEDRRGEVTRLELESSRVTREVETVRRERDDFMARFEQVDREMQDVQARARRDMEGVEEELERERAMVDDLRRELDTMEERFRSEAGDREVALDQLRNDLEATHQAALQALRDRHDMEVATLNEELTQLTKELASSSVNDDVMAAHEDQMAKLRMDHESEIAEYETRLNEMKSRVRSAEDALVGSRETWFGERERLSEELDRLRKETEESRKVRAVSDQKLADYDKLIATRTEELETTKDKLKTLETEHASLSKEFEATKKELEETTSKLDESLSIASEISSIQQLLSTREDEVSTYRQQAEQYRTQYETYVESLKSKEAEFEEGKQLVMTMQDMVMQLKKGRVELVEECEDARYREEMCRRKLAGLETEVGKLQREVSSLTANNATLQSQLGSSSSEMESLREKVAELSVEKLGATGPAGAAGEGSQLASTMRSDFRKLVAEMRADFKTQLEREVKKREEVEVELRRVRREGGA
ncbi:hypothetical protein HDU85_005198 [Gaertneriomyces sp. JEL0708]|nr:hypothetical protein HDU85_005198 [Gaertneriomyces sp. JEL0708]